MPVAIGALFDRLAPEKSKSKKELDHVLFRTLFMIRDSQRITSLDGVRGLLATFVALAHLPHIDGVHDDFVVPSRLAVMCFFALSGYVLTRSWNGDFGVFLARRFLRLWPVFALCIATGALLLHEVPPWTYFIWYPLMGGDSYVAFDPPAWSLFIEAWAMAFMPLIVWCGRSQARVVVGVTACVALAAFNPNAIYGVAFIAGSYCSRMTFRNRFLESAMPQWLGKVSYSLYLTHSIVYGVIDHRLTSPAAPLLCAVAALITAQIVCSLVEAPSIELSRKVGQIMRRVRLAMA